MYDIKLELFVGLNTSNKHISESLSHDLADNITSYLNDSWGLNNSEFFIVLNYNVEQLKLG